jgi:tetratricopeptide (TPR) repeat protein
MRVRAALRCELADMYAAAGRHRDALRVFEEVLSLDRHNLRAVCGAGWAQLHLGFLEHANRAFKRVIGTPTADPAQVREAFHGRGWIAYREGHLRDAVKAFTRALQAADPARDGAAIREIRNALKRAYYLTGEKNVTLDMLARTSGSSRLQLAMRMHGRAAKNRMSRLLLAFRREQVH